MRLAVYGAVLAITLGSVLLGLDWVSAPMSPMVDTQAGLHAVAPPRVIVAPAPPVSPAPASPKASIGVPIVPPSLVAPKGPNVPVSAGAAPQDSTPAPIAAPEPRVRCNVEACTAAYHSFTASDCTYQPSNGPRRLCAK
jgi:hypothetical protein